MAGGDAPELIFSGLGPLRASLKVPVKPGDLLFHYLARRRQIKNT